MLCSLPKYFLHTREQNEDDSDVLRCLRTNLNDVTTKKATKIQKLEQGNIVKDIPASGLDRIISFFKIFIYVLCGVLCDLIQYFNSGFFFSIHVLSDTKFQTVNYKYFPHSSPNKC